MSMLSDAAFNPTPRLRHCVYAVGSAFNLNL